MPEIIKIVFLRSSYINYLGYRWYYIYLYDNDEMTVSWGKGNTTYGTRTRKNAGTSLFYKRVEDKIKKGYCIREIR